MGAPHVSILSRQTDQLHVLSNQKKKPLDFLLYGKARHYQNLIFNTMY